MRFSVMSPYHGVKAQFDLLKDAVEWIDDKFRNSTDFRCLLDWYIYDTETGKNVTQEQASKYR